MKRIIGILLAFMMAFTLGTSAFADTAFTLVSGLAIWAQPETTNYLCVVNNATQLVVTGQYDSNWYYVDMYQSGLGEEGQIGYVLQRYVQTQTYTIQLPRDGILFYADPWSGKCNGERYAGEKYTVISENEQWIVVQINGSSPGSAFIWKEDIWGYSTYNPEPDYGSANVYIPANVYWNLGLDGNSGMYGPNTYVEYEADWYIPQKWSVAIRVRPLTEVPDEENKKLIILHQGDQVHVIANCGEFAFVRYDIPDQPGAFIEGYVATKYWAVVGQ